MSPYISGYLIIFIPLIFSALCFITTIPKFDFIISTAASLLVFGVTINLLPDLLTHEKIVSDIDIGAISLATEYRIDLLGIFFLLLTVFIKIISGFFYKTDIDKIFDKDGKRLFYCANLLNLFGLIGIFTTDNILNLYVFIEIYSFTFYAITSMSKDLLLTKLAFRYFCMGAASSILLLISFLSLYIITGGAHISSIISDTGYLLEVNKKIAALIFLLTAMAIFLKFFPIWLYFEKIKSNNFLANFLSISSLFIKTNIGLYLLIRLSFFLFGNGFGFQELKFDIILIIAGIILVFYSNIKLLRSHDLKVIASYLCLTNLGFIITGIGIHNKESLMATFFYIINFSLINFLIFLFASFLNRNYKSCNLKYLHNLRKENFFISIPLKIIILFASGFPLTVMFLANWYLAYSIMNFDLFLFILTPLITTSFVGIKLITDVINNFYFKNEDEELLRKSTISRRDNFLYLISFWIMLIIAVAFGIGSGVVTDVNNRLSVFIVSNTI